MKKASKKTIRVNMKDVMQMDAPKQAKNEEEKEDTHSVNSLSYPSLNNQKNVIEPIPQIQLTLPYESLSRINRIHPSLRTFELTDLINKSLMKELQPFLSNNHQFLEKALNRFLFNFNEILSNVKSTRMEYMDKGDVIYKSPQKDEFQMHVMKSLEGQVREEVDEWTKKREPSLGPQKDQEKDQIERQIEQEIKGISEVVQQEEIRSQMEARLASAKQQTVQAIQSRKQSLNSALKVLTGELIQLQHSKRAKAKIQKFRTLQNEFQENRRSFKRWDGIDGVIIKLEDLLL